MNFKLNEFTFMDATEQAELVKHKQVKPIELVEAAIRRIESVNPSLNAVILTMYDQARDISSGPLQQGAFTGVPFLIKDFLAECEGFEFNEGSKFLKGYVPLSDSELVKRYKASGLIFVGKTNTPEFAIGPTTEPRLNGPTHNPWDLSRTAGGSSGGAAAAVAARMLPIAHGNDAGGSIRIPAGCCGVFGLKPTRGRNPLGPHYGDLINGLVSEHVLTISVRDSANILDVSSGPNAGDPYSAPPPKRNYIDEVTTHPGQLRIAFSTQTPLGSKLHPEAIKSVRETAQLCIDLGHQVTEISPSFDAETMWRNFTTMLAAGFAWSLKDWERRLNKKATQETIEPFVWSFMARGNEISGSDYLLAVQTVQRIARDVAIFFEKYDVWLGPTLGEPPVPLGTFAYSGNDPFELRRKMTAFTPFNFISNATGQPSMSVPLYWTDDGLPIGSHFTGKFGDEATLFRLAAQLEHARPWANRLPPTVAS
jgi:amidase